LRWYKNGAILPASNRFSPNYDLQTGIATLKIPDALTHDSGHYEVVAENDVGSDRTACHVLVENVPAIDKTPIIDPNAFRYIEPQRVEPPKAPVIEEPSAVPPNVIVPLSDVYTKEGEIATFSCKIYARPKPTVKKTKKKKH
jgi:hypothetical protein